MSASETCVSSGLAALRFSKALRDHDRPHQFHLASDLRTISNALRLCFFGDREQLAHVLGKVAARCIIRGQARPRLRRLVRSDLRHIVGGQINRRAVAGLDLPDNQADGKNDADTSGNPSFSC